MPSHAAPIVRTLSVVLVKDVFLTNNVSTLCATHAGTKGIELEARRIVRTGGILSEFIVPSYLHIANNYWSQFFRTTRNCTIRRCVKKFANHDSATIYFYWVMIFTSSLALTV